MLATPSSITMLKGKEKYTPSKSPNILTSSNWLDFLTSLEKVVGHPNHVVMTCGCLVPDVELSENVRKKWNERSSINGNGHTEDDSCSPSTSGHQSAEPTDTCPSCHSQNVQILAYVPILNKIYQMVTDKKKEFDLSPYGSTPHLRLLPDSSSSSSATFISSTNQNDTVSSVTTASATSEQKKGLIELLKEAAAAATGVAVVTTATSEQLSKRPSTASTTGDTKLKFDVDEWVSNLETDQQSQRTQISQRSQGSQLSQLSQLSELSHETQVSQTSQASSQPQSEASSQQLQPQTSPQSQPPPSQPPSIYPPSYSTSPISQKFHLHGTFQKPPPQSQSEMELHEYNFSKSFPIYRKQFVHPTQPRNFLRSNKTTLISAISPDINHILFASKGKCLFYTLPEDFNDPPILQHTVLLETTSDTSDAASIRSNKTTSSVLKINSNPPPSEWDKPMISITNSIAVVASPTGTLKVYKLEQGYPEIYSYQSSFGIHCMTVSPRGDLIAYAIVGRDKNSGGSQPMIVIHRFGGGAGLSTSHNSTFSTDSVSWNEENVSIVTLTIPYRDPIATLSFSSDEYYLSCSTCTESRFMVISVMNPQEPRLVMKSSRRADVSPEYEGITSVKFFPSNSRFLAVTSVATSAPPIILDSKVSTSTRSMSSGASSGLSHPSVMMRVDKVGSSIHKAEISPRGDSVAFLDKNGLVSVMYSKGMISELKRITIVDEVASAPSIKEAAAMRFSPTGHVLVLADRKGDVHIEDFAGGLPHQAGMGKCRILS